MARRKSKRPCSVDECAGLSVARGWCRRHYNAWHATGEPFIRSDAHARCETCGAAVFRAKSTGPTPKYCSPTCRRVPATVASLARQREHTRAVRPICPVGGCVELVPFRKHLCPTHAKERAALRSPDSTSRECSELECCRPVRARGVCSMHHKRLLRAEGKLGDSWNDRRRRNDQTRRARKMGAFVEAVDLNVVMLRDGYLCGICGDEVEPSLKHPDPLSRSLDHIVPLARGGLHSYSNTQLAHLGCNVSKGASVAA